MVGLHKGEGKMMKRNMYGYVRVSSKDQHTDRQRIALIDHGILQKNLFEDKQSGKDFERPQYKTLVNRLKENDCVVITSLDRLGRNYAEILKQWYHITHVKKADIVVLDMPVLNMRDITDSLTRRFLSDIVLQVLSYVAETERNNIRKRQAEGIAAAKAKGVKLGRPRRKIPENFKNVVSRIRQGELTYKEAAGILKVSYSWLYKKVASGNF